MRINERIQVERFEVGSELSDRAYGPTPAQGTATSGILAAAAVILLVATLVVIEGSSQLITLVAIAGGVIVLMKAVFASPDRGHM
jgi:hypothetical protein